ncbi:MAG: hypothetical protein IPN29_04030 [Saprospiraceae bacterium]|nr:hypothetical protein [Saprospiraceae bacterium]
MEKCIEVKRLSDDKLNDIIQNVEPQRLEKYNKYCWSIDIRDVSKFWVWKEMGGLKLELENWVVRFVAKEFEEKCQKGEYQGHKILKMKNIAKELVKLPLIVYECGGEHFIDDGCNRAVAMHICSIYETNIYLGKMS